MHPVYENGPDCDEQCPGDNTLEHATYRAGHLAGERYLSGLVLKVMPAPYMPRVPSWVWGPTRKKWAEKGIQHTINSFGFRR